MGTVSIYKFIKTPAVIVLAAVLTACGGGSGSPNTGDTIGGGGGDDDGAGSASGTFVDSPVNGLEYEGNPSGEAGVTGDNGTEGGFVVEDGDTVTFLLGDIELGTSQAVSEGADNIVTPAEIAGEESNFNNPRAVRIAQFLQSLDEDNDTGNGIQIAEAVRTRLSDGSVDAAELTAVIRDGFSANTGQVFESFFGGVIDDLTEGNAGRSEGDIVSASVAKAELAAAVSDDTGGTARDVIGGQPIVAAETASCPAGVASSNRVDIFGQSFPICVLEGTRITSDVTLTNDHVYIVQGAVNVGDGDAEGGPGGNNNAVLTVEPGTQIFGHEGLLSGLIITRGSRIEAAGTADLPIIMAAVQATGTGSSTAITDDPTDLTGRGQWAGLVLSGFGENNQCTGSEGSGTLFSEATPTGTERFFGCNDNADNSGTVEYVIIAESGLGFRPDQEVQGLTLEGVGSGTRINNLQVLGSEDDGIEWFGGAVNASNVVINGQDDDGLDFDEGAQLTVQRALVIMGSNNGDKGIEADNAGPTNDATPVSRVNFVNLSIIGDVGLGDGSRGANFRRGFGARLIRSAIVDGPGAKAFGRGCLDFDDQVDEFTQLRDVVVDCQNGSGTGGIVENADNTLTADFANNRTREDGTASVDEVDFAEFTGSLNAETLALENAGTPDNPLALPESVNGVPVGDYLGAVDPDAGAPDGDPNNNGAGGGPFWDGWTYINSAVDGNLPGANFHPLRQEIE